MSSNTLTRDHTADPQDDNYQQHFAPFILYLTIKSATNVSH
jgi:hypothetical protein